MAGTTDKKYPSREELWGRFNELKDKVDDKLHVKDKFDRIVEYANEHPLIALSVGVAVVMSSIPVVVFASFVVTTIFISFLAFVFVEGTLLTFGGIILSGILIFIMIFTVGLCLLATAAWFTFDLIIQLINTAQQKYLNRRNLNEKDIGKKGPTGNRVDSLKAGDIVDAADKDCH